APDVTVQIIAQGLQADSLEIHFGERRAAVYAWLGRGSGILRSIRNWASEGRRDVILSRRVQFGGRFRLQEVISTVLTWACGARSLDKPIALTRHRISLVAPGSLLPARRKTHTCLWTK